MLAHNIETVPRIFRRIRPGFRYERSLDVITQARAAGMVTKSNLILGMGETREEVSEALADLRRAGCELVTITQYLRPSKRHHPVERWVKPEEFVELQEEASEIGFAGRHERPAGALVVPGRAAVRRGDAARGGASIQARALIDPQRFTSGHLPVTRLRDAVSDPRRHTMTLPLVHPPARPSTWSCSRTAARATPAATPGPRWSATPRWPATGATPTRPWPPPPDRLPAGRPRHAERRG